MDIIIAKLDIVARLHECIASTIQLEHLLWELGTMDQAISDAIGRLQQTALAACQKEIDDVKELVESGASTQEIVDALDAASANVATAIDAISVGASAPPPPPTP